MMETAGSNDCSVQKLPSKRFIDTNTLLLRFDGRSRLLLRTLLSGATGARRALCVFQRQRRSSADLSLHTCLDTLCQEEICPGDATEPLVAKPLVCLFPHAFRQTLLSFLHLVHSALPRTSVLRLLDCLSQAEPTPTPWTSALIRQLHRDMGGAATEPLFTPQCGERLRGLCEPLCGGGGAGISTGWASYFSRRTELRCSRSGPELVGGVSQRKRKSSCVGAADADAEKDGRRSKRRKTDLGSAEEGVGGEGPGEQAEEGGRDGSPGKADGLSNEAPVEVDPRDALPEIMKASIPRIKELLDSESEWDQSSVDLLKVLNDCDPSQVDVFCGMLSLSEIPEQTLLQLCGALLALSPDFSHSTAAVLIKRLLLAKVVSLSEPASRCLVNAATSLCSRYPRPTCYALIGPVLEGQTGSAQAEFLNRLMDDCLEPHYRLLVFEMILRGVWSEGLLTVIHGLLDSKLELNEELFTLFTEQLNIQAPRFSKSMKFAKMMLTVLTKYSSHVTSAHVKTLSCCLSSNETFLAKSLQAALKRITT